MQAPRVELKRFPRNAIRRTAENRYWASLKPIKVERASTRVSSVSFCEKAPRHLASASGPSVRLFDGHTGALSKTVTRFKDDVYTAAYRADGALLAAAGAEGVVNLFETTTKGLIREFKGHDAPVHCTWFTNDELRVVSTSDDRTCRVWDVPSQSELHTLSGHTDYVRCGTAAPRSENLVITGSYDHSVRGWDLREAKAPVWTIDHGHPVNAVQLLPSGSMLATAGDRFIKIWDLVAGGRLVQTLSNHQKAVTCLSLARVRALGGGSGGAVRLLAGSLDEQLKFYQISDFSVTHTMRFEAPILCCGVSNDADNPVLAVGTVNGTLSVRRRRASLGGGPRSLSGLALDNPFVAQRAAARAAAAAAAPAVRVGSKRYWSRGASHAPEAGDRIVTAKRKRRERPYDQYLRRFQYNNALDAALREKHPLHVVSVLEELMQREALRNALAGRDDRELQGILAFTTKHISNPHYAATLVETASIIIDLYGSVCGQSSLTDELVVKLKHQVAAEIRLQEDVVKVLGTAQLLAAAADA